VSAWSGRLARAFGPPLAVALCLLAGPALAEPVRVVVLSQAPPREVELARLVDEARRAVDAHEALQAIDLTQLLDPESAPAEAEARLAEAQAAYENLEAETALRILDTVGPVLVASGARRPAARAFELTARIRLGLREREGAIAACRMWLSLEDPPNLDGGAPPSLIEALEAARQSGGGAAGGALRVDAPIPALVHLDGRPLGITPVFVPTLSPGLHVVSVEADGFRRSTYVVEPKGEMGVAVNARLRLASRGRLLDDVFSGLTGQLDQDPAGPGLRDLRGLAAADQAVLLEWTPEGPRGALFDLQAGRRVRLVRLPGGTGADLVGALYQGFDPRAPGLAAPEIEIPDLRPYHERWWFWPAVAAAAITAVAVPVSLLAEDPPAGLTRKPGTGAVIVRF
jgi:hypothetical protein